MSAVVTLDMFSGMPHIFILMNFCNTKVMTSNYVDIQDECISLEREIEIKRERGSHKKQNNYFIPHCLWSQIAKPCET